MSNRMAELVLDLEVLTISVLVHHHLLETYVKMKEVNVAVS